MSIITGPKMEAIVQRAVDWYAHTRINLIEQLETPQPYGQTRLTPLEQLVSFDSMQPQDWDNVVAQLYDRYRGLPDAEDRVNKDLSAYVARMFTLRSQLEPQP